ncbi:pantetheine-phosphate adenylyltransferase [Aestuariispira insulae]|uniref:Phosphopantetheine adenylyltransferase n=1 Tax=Aestuariispira insulae TaxID=1461337 RepID=A0A3D9HNI7_9PROT|nr:pantetheine-phosphate adenylyltransferase [Aestuariispira insulae]RED51063.1 phosphopantetheine adenylyltransferase [Aestuariispira insulae]
MTAANKALRVGIYPGTFDPITNGHLDIISRATNHLCDRLIVSVAVNAGKSPLFSLEERVAMVETAVSKLDVSGEILVTPFDNLLIHHAENVGASLIVRGLRAVSDFDYEFQMTGMNAKLSREIETIFLMASEKHQFISSRFVKEICALGGDIAQFVPSHVENCLKEKFKS